MQNSIFALCSNPTSKVRVNGRLSDAFSLSICSRQGCPFSPLLFVLTLEPLLNQLRNYHNIKGINVMGRTYKIVAFTNDILLFLSNEQFTIPNLLKDFIHYHYDTISNLQTNFAKLFALNIMLPKTKMNVCKSSFPFSWHKRSIIYLKIQLPSLSDLHMLNYFPYCVLSNETSRPGTRSFSLGSGRQLSPISGSPSIERAHAPPPQ